MVWYGRRSGRFILIVLVLGLFRVGLRSEPLRGERFPIILLGPGAGSGLFGFFRGCWGLLMPDNGMVRPAQRPIYSHRFSIVSI